MVVLYFPPSIQQHLVDVGADPLEFGVDWALSVVVQGGLPFRGLASGVLVACLVASLLAALFSWRMATCASLCSCLVTHYGECIVRIFSARMATRLRECSASGPTCLSLGGRHLHQQTRQSTTK